MLSSIHPLGERGRRNRFGTTAAAFAVGSVLGGSVIGGLVGTLGVVLPLSTDARQVLLVLAAMVALVFDVTGRSLPSLQRQVNEDWLVAYRGWVYGLGFGFQLGAGVLTYITAAAVVLWMGSMIAVNSVPLAIVIGATFGLARGLSLLAARRVTSPDRLRRLFRQLHSTAPTVRRIGIGALSLLTLAGASAMIAS